MERVDVSILDRDYSLACEASEKRALLEAVQLVDQRMVRIKGSGKISSNERIAVMAAIQIAAELLAMRTPEGALGGIAVGDFKRRIDDMNHMIDEVLNTGNKAKA